jgi:hypothetical protein
LSFAVVGRGVDARPPAYTLKARANKTDFERSGGRIDGSLTAQTNDNQER